MCAPNDTMHLTSLEGNALFAWHLDSGPTQAHERGNAQCTSKHLQFREMQAAKAVLTLRNTDTVQRAKIHAAAGGPGAFAQI